jgi:hypothetical protein
MINALSNVDALGGFHSATRDFDESTRFFLRAIYPIYDNVCYLGYGNFLAPCKSKSKCIALMEARSAVRLAIVTGQKQQIRVPPSCER